MSTIHLAKDDFSPQHRDDERSKRKAEARKTVRVLGHSKAIKNYMKNQSKPSDLVNIIKGTRDHEQAPRKQSMAAMASKAMGRQDSLKGKDAHKDDKHKDKDKHDKGKETKNGRK